MLDGLLFLVLPAALLIIGAPIFLALLITSIAIVLARGMPTGAIQIYMFGSLDNFPLLAVPYFVLAGEIMARGGVAKRVILWVMSLIGGVRGSLAVTTVAASELFGAMTHTSVGTVVAVGRMLEPPLRENGYDQRFAMGLIASSGAIAVVIPPSIAMIIYSMVAQQSAIALFTAGVLPSLLIGLIVLLYARIKGVAGDDGGKSSSLWKTTKDASWSIGTIVLIFGGIYGGVFTPTEAAGVAVIYSLFVTIVIHREVRLSEFLQIFKSAIGLIAQIMLVVTAAGVYASLLTTSGIPQQIVAQIIGWHLPVWATLLSLNIVLLAMGSFLEPPAAILILTPLLLPIVQSVGIHPIHFCIILAVNLSPFGLNLFASQAVFGQPIGTIYRGVWPFVLINFLALLLITYVPAISMALVR
jgi:C4-dicarboxylate transporter, DctM subunit